jgi:hypothetical protein
VRCVHCLCLVLPGASRVTLAFETIVTQRFLGAYNKASNWLPIGLTGSRSRMRPRWRGPWTAGA